MIPYINVILCILLLSTHDESILEPLFLLVAFVYLLQNIFHIYSTAGHMGEFNCNEITHFLDFL